MEDEEVSLSYALPSLPITSIMASLSPSLPPATDSAASPEFLRGLNWVPNSEDEAEEDALMAEIDEPVATAEIDEAFAGAETKLVTSDGKDACDREEWRRRRGIGIPCSRCGLIHGEYTLGAWIYGFKEFDCKVIFLNIDDLKMEGDTILLPEHIWMTESAARILDSINIGDKQY